MGIYLGLYMLIIAIGFWGNRKLPKEKSTKIIFLISSISIGFVMAFRGFSIGEDTNSYVKWFQIIGEYGWEKSFHSLPFKVEYGYIFLNLLLNFFTDNARILLIITGFAIAFLHMFFLKENSKEYIISIILYFGIGFFSASMTPIRQFLAMGIILWTVPLLEKRKYGLVVLMGILSFLFHQSSMLYFVACIICWFILNKTKWIKFLVLAELISIPFLPYITAAFLKVFPKYTFYFEQGKIMGLGKLRTVYIIIELIIIILYCRKKDIQNKKNTVFVFLLSISAYIGILNAYIPYIFRLGYYFDYTLLLMIPELIPANDKKKRYLYMSIITVLSTLLFVYYLKTNASGIVPYKFM